MKNLLEKSTVRPVNFFHFEAYFHFLYIFLFLIAATNVGISSRMFPMVLINSSKI